MIFTLYPLSGETKESYKRRLEYRRFFRLFGNACIPKLEGLSKKERFHHIGIYLAYLSLSGRSGDKDIGRKLTGELKGSMECAVEQLPSQIIKDIGDAINMLAEDGDEIASYGLSKILRQLEVCKSFLEIPPSHSRIHKLSKILVVKSRKFLISPPVTGFFSFLEHLTLGIYHSLVTRGVLYVDGRNWPYRDNLDQILPVNSFLQLLDAESTNKVDWEVLSCDWLRDKYLGSLDTSRDILFSVKAWMYGRIYLKVNTLGYAALDPRRNIYFIRAGDKLLNEGELAPTVVYQRMIQADPDAVVLSDSVSLLAEIMPRERLQECLEMNRKAPISGAYLQGNGIDCEDILFKWKSMIDCNCLFAMYDSNLANTAGLVRSFLCAKESGKNRVFFTSPTLHI